LDVGCGEGTNTAFLAECFPGARVTGIDFSSEGVLLAERRYAAPGNGAAKTGGLSFIADNESATLKNYRFDLISSFDVLEHVPDWREFLINMCRSANKYILLAVPTGRMRSFESKVGHLRNFKIGEIESFLTSLGWLVEKSFYAGFPFYSPIYRNLCDLLDVGDNDVVRFNYGFFRRLMCRAIFWLFDKCSTRRRRGDYFIGLFAKDGADKHAARPPVADDLF
jgi:SAM-dependent methyltransferase